MFNIENSSSDLEKSGVWTEFGGGEFLVANVNNIAFQREFSRLQAPYRKKIERGTLDPKIQLDIMAKAMAKGILLDWKNVGTGSEEIPYSQEVCVKVLTNNSGLREYIEDFSTNLDNFRNEEIEETGES